MFEGKRIKKKELEDYEVLYRIEGGGAIRKTWPISPTPTKEKYSYSPEDLAEDILDRTEKLPDTAIIARRIVGARFGYSEEAVKKKCNKKKQRHERETRTDWRLLATIFLELGSHGKRKLQARILDCLLSSGYSRFNLYYLVQISHSLDKPISLRPCPSDQVTQLCRLVCPEQPTGPFSQLHSD